MRCEKVMNVSQRGITVKAAGERTPFRAAIPTLGPIYQGAINWERGRKADEHEGADSSTFAFWGGATPIFHPDPFPISSP